MKATEAAEHASSQRAEHGTRGHRWASCGEWGTPNKQARYCPQLPPLNRWVFAPHKRGKAHFACRAVAMETTEPLPAAVEQTQQELCLGLLPPELLVAVFAHVPLEER